MENDVKGGTIFHHKGIQMGAQIDHIIINNKWPRSLLDVKAHHGTDVGSDLHLLIAKVRLKLQAILAN